MDELIKIIELLDGKNVSTYTKLYGRYERNGITYQIRNVYGGQTKNATVDIEIPIERLIGDCKYDPSSRIPLTAFIMREFSVAAHIANDTMQQSEANTQKGLFGVYKFGTRVLPNSAVQVNKDFVTISMTIKLPFNNTAYNTGRRADPTLDIKAQSGSVLALSAQAQKESFNNRKKGIISAKALKLLLIKNLPSLTENFVADFNIIALNQAILLWRNQEYIRYYLKKHGYVSFIANGALLPRKGKTDYKDSKGAVPFISPKSMEISILLPDGETISGMALPKGITLITGDAYHGKSTILEALREGVYNHVLGDGREYVITDNSAMTVQAEDGRSIKNTDISFFLRKLPVRGILPESFSTDNASGSTSQAAAVTEALESACKLMLFDEDRSANNFMYKDEKMRSVIKNASTTPFLDNARMLYEKHNVSSIIVVGASGEYFRVADKVLLVESFTVSEYTDYSKDHTLFAPSFSPDRRLVDFASIRKIFLARNVEIKDDSTIKIGSETVNIPDIIPHVTRGQLDFICSFIYYLTVMEQPRTGNMNEIVKSLYRKMDSMSIQKIHQTGLKGTTDVIEYVRPEDILSILFRLKCINFKER